MTELMTAPPPAAPAAIQAGPSAGRAMLALARVESVRLLRHPFTIAALVLFMAPWAFGSGTSFPVLYDAAANLQLLGLFALGSGALLAANLAVLRGHRHRLDELHATLVLPRPWRVGAMLLSLLPLGGLVTLVVAGRLTVLALLPGAVGRPDAFEVLTTPAVVMLWGALGVLLGALFRTPLMAPLVVVMLATVMFGALIAGIQSGPWVLQLTPVTPILRDYALPVALIDRTPGPHLLYVLGILGIVAVAALYRSGARRVVVAAVAAVAVAAGGGLAPFRADPALERLQAEVTRDPARLETCRQLGAVQYCAVNEFERWIPQWDEVVRAVIRPAPAIAGPPLVVRQRVWLTGRPDDGAGWTSNATDDEARVTAWRDADTAAGHPQAVMIGTDWNTDTRPATFAAAVAYRILTGTTLTSALPVCGARGALMLWLIGQATPATARGLRLLDESSGGAIAFPDPNLLTFITIPDRDAAPALTLLNRPAAETTPLVRAHWPELADPSTPLERFGELLNVPVPPAPSVEERPTCAP